MEWQCRVAVGRLADTFDGHACHTYNNRSAIWEANKCVDGGRAQTTSTPLYHWDSGQNDATWKWTQAEILCRFRKREALIHFASLEQQWPVRFSDHIFQNMLSLFLALIFGFGCLTSVVAGQGGCPKFWRKKNSIAKTNGCIGSPGDTVPPVFLSRSVRFDSRKSAVLRGRNLCSQPMWARQV